MRSLYIIITVLISSFVFAQPHAFKYQSVVRDSNGELLVNTNVAFQISILKEAVDGNAVYVEEHQATTSNYGSVTLEIGRGENPTSDFSAIDWGSSSHFIQIAWDLTGGTNYELAGTSELLSVPYALNAKTASQLVLNDENNNPYELIIVNDELRIKRLTKPNQKPNVSSFQLVPIVVGFDNNGDMYDYDLSFSFNTYVNYTLNIYMSKNNTSDFVLIPNLQTVYPGTIYMLNSILNTINGASVFYFKVSFSNEFGEGPLSDSYQVVLDKDGDGYQLGYDCDDDNTMIHPDAIEICGNEIDENCDGDIGMSLSDCASGGGELDMGTCRCIFE